MQNTPAYKMVPLCVQGHSPACLDRAGSRVPANKPLLPTKRPSERHLSPKLQAQKGDQQGLVTSHLQQLVEKCRTAASDLPLAARGVTAAALVSAAVLTGTQLLHLISPVCSDSQLQLPQTLYSLLKLWCCSFTWACVRHSQGWELPAGQLSAAAGTLPGRWRVLGEPGLPEPVQ